MINKIPVSFLIFIGLIPIIFLLQSSLLMPHLRYGFADVDWGFLLAFKQFSAMYHDPISHLTHAWKSWGVYTYQVYYMGIVEHFFPIDGFNFVNFHKATHFLKFLSILTIFPLISMFTEKKLLAAITTILYGVSYSALGPLYSAAVSGNYPAIAVMNLFLTYYIFIVKKNKKGLIWFAGGMLLFLVTLFLSTERMYPLIPLLVIGEFFWVWSQKFSRSVIRTSIARVSIFLSPLIIFSLFKMSSGSSAFAEAEGFFVNTVVIFQKISEGNWSVALTPLIALGSLFLPREYWGVIGANRNAINGFSEFFGFFIGPFFKFFFFTSFLSFFILKKPVRFITYTSVITFMLGAIIFILASHHLSIDQSLRLNFDTMFLKPILIAVFILSLTISLLFDWVLNGKKELYNLYLFIGPAVAFLFIFVTWLPSSYTLLFEGVHRYLAIPAIGSIFFIATLITFFYEKINKVKILHNFSWLILLSILPIIQLNFFIANNYFSEQLESAGMDGEGQTRMKSELLSYIGNFDLNEPTLFYFDEQDRLNGYFHETAIIAGFEPWIRFRGKSVPILGGVIPQYIRNSNLGSETNVYCTGQNVDCMGTLKSFVSEQNGRKGILYKNVFYPSDKFYAFRLKDKDVFDIKSEITQEIGLD